MGCKDVGDTTSDNNKRQIGKQHWRTQTGEIVGDQMSENIGETQATHFLTLPNLTSAYLTLPYLTLPYLTLPYHTLPYLTFTFTFIFTFTLPSPSALPSPSP